MGKLNNFKLAIVCLAAMFTAIICVVSQFSVMLPFGVPLTFQIPAVALCGYLLGIKWSVASVVTYILIGAVGIPVFSGFRGGVSIVLGPTGGYILGFVFLALLCGLSHKVKPRLFKIGLGALGVALCYISGTVQLILQTEINLNTTFVFMQICFFIKDILLSVGMFFGAKAIEKVLKLNL